MDSDGEHNKQAILERVREGDPSAKDFKIELVPGEILKNKIFYIEWSSSNRKQDETLCYAMVNDKGQIDLYDDGMQAVRGISELLERRKSLVQRLGDFNLFDLVGAVIALLVTGVVMYQVVGRGQLTQELVAVFGVILGYYFGKTTRSSS